MEQLSALALLDSIGPDPHPQRTPPGRCAPRSGRQRVFGAALLATSLATVFLAGCSKPKQAAAASAPAPAAAETATTQPDRQKPASIRTPTASTSRAAEGDSPQPPPPTTTPATSAELLQTARGAPVPPRDFRIGTLELASTGDEEDATSALARLLDGLTAGAVPADLYQVESRERLERSVAYYAGEKLMPTRYRVGRVRETDPGEIVVNVRLFGAKGVTEGEIYLVRVDPDRWVVSDLQIGFSLLAEPYTAPTEPFVPSSYEYEGTSSGVDED